MRAKPLVPWLDDLVRDLRHACRLLARSPGFTIVAVLSLAVGIGATCAVFSFADALLLRPLPVPNPRELLTIGSIEPLTQELVASYPEFVDLRDRTRSFAGLTAFASVTPAFAIDADTLATLRLGMLVSGRFFAAMGVEPRLGRGFTADEDEQPGRSSVVVLGHDFWRRELGGDPSVLGRRVRLNGIAFTIVGVAPPGFTGLSQYTRFDFYAPLAAWPQLPTGSRSQPLDARDFRKVTIKGRLRPGVTLSAAQAELAVLNRDLARAYPSVRRDGPIIVRTELQNRIAQAPPVARLLVMLATLAAAVLCVACANVAGLLASRAPVRSREIAVRLAIGAGRGRVVRQLVTESVLVAVIGGLGGLVVGYGGVLIFRQFQIPTDLPITVAFDLDRRALALGLAVSLISAVLFGLAPALRAARTDLSGAIKATEAAAFGRRRGWGRAFLVCGQISVSVVLLVLATVLYRSFGVLLTAGPGYRTDHLLQMSFDPTLLRDSDARVQQFFELVAQRTRSVPGVASAALASAAPTDVGPSTAIPIAPEGAQMPPGSDTVSVLAAVVDEQYFDTVRLPIVKGRAFRPTDSAAAPLVAIVNEHVAQLYWPGLDPVGKRFRVDGTTGRWAEIVGVAKTSKYMVLSEAPRPLIYLTYRQRPQQRMTLIVESSGDPAALAAPLRDVVRSVDANQPIYNARTIEASYRMRMVTIFDVIVELVGAMGTMGLVLAIVGLYGLVAYAASRRTREIGIRMAIGAGRGAVLRMIVRQGALLAVIGLAVGLLAGAAVRRAMGAAFAGGGTREPDLAAFALVAIGVLAVTLGAALIPARRASRMNPIDALRHE